MCWETNRFIFCFPLILENNYNEPFNVEYYLLKKPFDKINN